MNGKPNNLPERRWEFCTDLKEDEIYFLLRPGYYVTRPKSSDQVREVVVLDPGQVEELSSGVMRILQTTSPQHGDGTVRPVGPGQPRPPPWETTSSTTLWQTRHGRLGCRPSQGGEVALGWVVPIPACSDGSYLPQIYQAKRRCGNPQVGWIRGRLDLGNLCHPVRCVDRWTGCRASSSVDGKVSSDSVDGNHSAKGGTCRPWSCSIGCSSSSWKPVHTSFCRCQPTPTRCARWVPSISPRQVSVHTSATG